MDKNLKNTVKTAKKAKKLKLVYFDDGTNPVVKPNYQLLASMIESMNPMISISEYEEIQDDNNVLLWQLSPSTFD